VILGTGVGGGLVLDRRVLTGVNAIAGEWGHNPLPLAAPEDLPLRDCYCGRQGCIETYLSGPAFAQDTMDLYLLRLARSLAGVINILDPDVIVLGGGVSNVQRLYDEVPHLCKEYVFSDDIRTKIVPPMYGDSSGVRGAAWLWND
jgi:fructokinase